MSIVVLCPSRGRPEAARALAKSIRLTAKDPGTKLVFLVDSDDKTWQDYPTDTAGEAGGRIVIAPPPGCMNKALNQGAALVMADPAFADATVLGFVGDDHRFRTQEWDLVMGRFLDEHPGVAYADDLFQGVRLPTMWFVSRSIAQEFGMGHPEMKHLWIDNYWKELAEAAGCLYFFSHIVIEHLHPAAGKAEWDENYLRVNSSAVADHDRGVFDQWMRDEMVSDADRVKAIIGR